MIWLLLRAYARDMRQWWRSRRWVRRRIIAKYARKFIPMDGTDNGVLEFASAPGVVIRQPSPTTFPVMVVPSLNERRRLAAEKLRDQHKRELELMRYTPVDQFPGVGTVVTNEPGQPLTTSPLSPEAVNAARERALKERIARENSQPWRPARRLDS